MHSLERQDGGPKLVNGFAANALTTTGLDEDRAAVVFGSPRLSKDQEFSLYTSVGAALQPHRGTEPTDPYIEGRGKLIRAKKSTAVDAAVGARIRHLRLRSKLSQTEVGKQIGVSFQQVQKYENGSNRVSAGRLAQLARLFGMPVTAFYSEIAGRDEKPIRRARLGASFVDVTADRLVKAFESIEDRKLKSVMLQLIEEMVRRQYRK